MNVAKCFRLLAATLFVTAAVSLAQGATPEAQTTPALSNSDCVKCHAQQAGDIEAKGLSHKTAVGCQDCHVGHPPSTPKKDMIPACSNCHNDKPHFKLAKCLSCHRNPHTPKVITFGKDVTDPMLDAQGWADGNTFEITWILPREHRSSFETAGAEEVRAVAEALRTMLRKIDVALERPASHFLLHAMPLREPPNDFYHWHLELKPVLAQHAGFEWASGCYINPTPPEEAASFLRQTEVFP